MTVGKHAFDRDHYLAGADKDRASDLMDAFLNPDVDAVYCSRGGYGAARLIPHLDFDAIVAQRKLLIGFSDITSLHLALTRRGMPSLHAPMALSLSVERELWVYASFLSALRGQFQYNGAPRAETLVPGVATGVVTGGCLCLLCDSLATTESLDTKGRIVLIEDVDENPHRVDAMLTHLLNAGLLQEAAGLLIGEMSGTNEREDSSIGARPWEDIVRDRITPLGIPSVIRYPFGHVKGMLSLPLGISAELNATEGTLEYTEALCA